MNQTASNGESLGVWDTLTQMVNVLGFHDMSSFIMTSVFLIAAAALLIGGGVVIVRKRRERLSELEKIVTEIQAAQPPVDRVPPVMADQEKPTPKLISTEALKKTAPPLVIEHEKPPALTVAEPVKKQKPPIAKKIIDKPKPIEPAPKPPKKIVTPPEPLVAREEKPIAPPPIAVHEEPVPQKEESGARENKAALGAALKNTRGGFMEKLARLFSRGAEVSDADFEEMEAILFTADIGAKTAQKLLDVMRERAKSEKSADKAFLRNVLKEEMTRILESAKPQEHDASSPQVLMFVGVNGAGKTTSIGKLGAQLAGTGKKVLFGAGDTFRAAAVEQLSVWGQRVGAEVVSGKENSDSASVLFEAIEKAKLNHVDYVLCDTAGRLHTKVSLMDELKKVHRVVSKAQTGAPHQVFLVIDATMGQNAINQAREFAAATPLTGVVLSKLDGTAKGGVALGIVDELKVPIRYIGIGERVADLRDFDAKLFVDALFEEA